MKKIKIFILLFLITLCSVFSISCKNENKITIAEVAHSVFYAPQYVALEKGFFLEEGLEVTIINANGADKVMAALLSKDAQIGLMGPEASIYVYKNGQENYAINFAQLTKRDGSFLVAREKIENFTWDMLKNSEILGGRKGGVPVMVLEHTLRKNGLIVGEDDPSSEVNVRTDVAFAAMGGAFTSGEADYVTLFEPTATALEKEGKGYVIASIGESSGEIPYTAYSALKDYISKNPEIIQGFTNALYKAQIWVHNHTAKEIAEVIHPYFPDLNLEDLTIVMQRHIDIDAWCDTPLLKKESLDKLMDIMIEANELDNKVEYEKIVTTKFVNNIK